MALLPGAPTKVPSDPWKEPNSARVKSGEMEGFGKILHARKAFVTLDGIIFVELEVLVTILDCSSITLQIEQP